MSSPAKQGPALFCLTNPVAGLFSPTGTALSSNDTGSVFVLLFILTKMLYKARNLDAYSLEQSSHHLNIHAQSPKRFHRDLVFISLLSLGSDPGDQWLSAMLGPVGRPRKATDTLSESRQTDLRSVSFIYKVIVCLWS